MGNRGEVRKYQQASPQRGERKRITILFADISDFTAYSRKRIPKQYGTLIS
jgi:class 3 adenylate cyclase